MEFVDNTGHIFSLPSYSEKPIGYEYDEYSYVFWIDGNNTSKLSVNNFYSKPIYALYELNKNFDIEDLEDDYNSALDIEIYVNNSNVYKLISSRELQKSISKDDFKLTDYVDLNMFETITNGSSIEYNEKYSFLKERLTNEDLYCVKTEEIKYADEQDITGTTINYLMIPIYPIAMSKEAGTWITNLMIHIHNNSNNTDEWCYISIGGEFIDEYEELIINGRNMGISLPKDILKSVYAESLYNDEYNEALFNEKMKEYMLNYMGIRGELGNFDSAIKSLKWFGYGDRIVISKLLKTDNDFKQQYVLDYFDISYDIIESFKTFIASAFVSLMIMINKETDNRYPFTFCDSEGGWDDLSLASISNKMSNKSFFYGENRPKMLSLLDYYQKIKIGNHDMPIENDDEKYWYWKPYFDFSFNELGVKLICLSYYYKKYFLPIHLNIHHSSLGYRVFTNNIKLTNSLHIIENQPSIVLNDKREVEFIGNGLHYFTKQIHYIDEYFNEFELGTTNIDEDSREWYYLNDTCVNIPVQFINNEFNKGYFNCVLLLQKINDNDKLFNSISEWYKNHKLQFEEFINITNKCKNIGAHFTIDEFKNIIKDTSLSSVENLNDFITFISKDLTYDNYPKNNIEMLKLIINMVNNNNIDVLYESHFNFYQCKNKGYRNFIIYPKKLNVITTENNVDTKYFEYWINNNFRISLLVNNKWYEYDFKLKIHNPTIDFGTLKYRYYFNDRNYLFSKITNKDNNSIHNLIFCGANDTYKINNQDLDYSNSLFRQPSIFNSYIFNLPNDYVCYLLDNSYIKELDKFNNEIKLSWTINWDNEESSTYYVYNYSEDKLLNINNATVYNGQLKYINIDNPVILICPNSWGYPVFIKNDLQAINQYLYYAYNLNQDIHNEWNQETWIQSFNLSEAEHIYQFFKDHYDLLSPFKQIRGLDNENNKVMFNAYMHNKQLVDMNEINFDVNFQTILKYHLDHNLLYMDGTLTDGEFYQYIIYKDTLGNNHEVYIHKDLIGYDISFFPDYLNDNDKILLCAYQGDIFILAETFDSSNDDKNYEILNASEIESEILFKTEDTEEFLKYDTIDIKYDYLDNTYKEYDENGDVIYTYEIYDKLYSNTDRIYSKYSSLVNLPNNPKYKNSLHLFGIYEREEKLNNILIFHNNIDMHIDGLRFTHGVTKDLNDDEQLKIFIQGTLDSSIDTRFPDTYGLYWTSPLADGHKPLAPSQVIEIKDRLGFYVKRDARKCYDPIRGTSAMHIWEVPNLYEFDTNEFTYYIESKETCVGTITYKTLNDFYANRQLSKNLNKGFEDIDIYVKEYEEGNVYCFDDKEICDLNDLSKYYANKLSYSIAFFDELDNRIEGISLNQIDNIEYNKIIVTFYYHKAHIVRNRFYILSDYLNYLKENNIENNSIISVKDNTYYLNIEINGSKYIVELIKYDDKYMYKDNSYNHLVSVQNPSMYWYNADKLSLESLPSYLNEIERYVYNENDSYETIKANLDNYLNNFKGNRYVKDEDIARYRFKNYLIKDLTGIKGKYRMEFITNIEQYATMHTEVIDENGNVTNYTEVGTEFEFTGNEKKITVFISINSETNINWNDRTDIYIIPKFIKISVNEKRLEYKPLESGKNIVKTKYLNQEFEYGDNDNAYIFNLYNDFFKLKFNVYDSYFENKELKNVLLHSVYEYDEAIKLDTYLNYDFYLMHDENYWYGLYISQETCDKIRTNEDLKLRNEADKKKILKNKYILNYEKSSEEYLINRLEFNTSEGFNQFKTDDIVCCYLHNNDRLPFNASISSKWNIHPMSLGMSTDTSFESNGEMTILSLPKNDAKYERGYYKVTVKYSLDRDIQHQFKNTSTIRIS